MIGFYFDSFPIILIFSSVYLWSSTIERGLWLLLVSLTFGSFSLVNIIQHNESWSAVFGW